jgi:hypothetical protein
MEVQELANYINYLTAEKEHVCVLLEGRRGSSKTITTYNLVLQLQQLGIDARFANKPKDVVICQFLLLDDFGKILYLRDYNKNKNKQAVKAIQSIRGAIPFLMITTPSISRLDKDFREFFGIHGSVIDFGWLDIEGVPIGPILPQALPPEDVEQRKEHFLTAMHDLEF